jgi:hypothetical protein
VRWSDTGPFISMMQASTLQVQVSQLLHREEVLQYRRLFALRPVAAEVCR